VDSGRRVQSTKIREIRAIAALRVDRWFYFPTADIYARPEEFGLNYQSVTFDSADQQLHGWFFPARGPAVGTVVHAHGNAGNVSAHFPYIAWMPASGWNVLCFDYRGYGRSGGRPSRRGTVEDTLAAIRYARSRPDVNPERIVLFGQSLGGAVALVAASERRGVRALAVEGAFATYRQAAQYVCAQSWALALTAGTLSRLLISAGCEPIDHVAHLAPTPVFFIAGKDDSICDYRQTLELHAAAAEPKRLWVIEGGRHAGAMLETDGEGPRRLDEFFRQALDG